MIIDSQFKPAWWMSNRHLQTIAAKWLKRNESIAVTQSSLETPDDDFIDLVWTEIPDKNSEKPIVVMLHGLQGSAESHYAKGMLNQIKAKGWIGLLMHFRGCGGRPNRQGPSYHSGDIRDISFLTKWLSAQYPQSPKLAIGYSLGGNVLTRYLASEPNNPYKAASIVCAPLDLASCSKRIGSGVSKIYQKYLVDMLKKSTYEKIDLQLLPSICPAALSKITKLWDFDHMVTAPINGFNGAEHYYTEASGKPVLAKIKQPCLFIHAADDPFLDHKHIVPKAELPRNITFEVCKKGGHVGFVAGNNPFKPKFWLEQRIPSFLSTQL